MSVTTNSPSQDPFYPDYQILLRCVTPGFKPFSISYYKKEINAKKNSSYYKKEINDKKKRNKNIIMTYFCHPNYFIKRMKLTVRKCAQMYYQEQTMMNTVLYLIVLFY